MTGLRPTYGRVSTRGVIPLFSSLDTVGPICRSVEDTSLLLQAIAGYDPADPGSFEIPVGNYHAALLARTSTLRIGIPRNPFFSELDPEIERAVSDALRVIERLTKRLVEVHLPARPQMSFGCEAWNYHRELLAKSPDAYSPLIRERIEMQAADCGPAYVDNLRNLELTRRAIRSTFVDVDLLITPTTAILPKSIEYTLREEGAAPLCPQLQYVSHQCMGVACHLRALRILTIRTAHRPPDYRGAFPGDGRSHAGACISTSDRMA